MNLRIRSLPDMSRTIKALAEYDALVDDLEAYPVPDEHFVDAVVRLEALGEAVGVAFGLDTADRNNLETCRQCVRPGPKNPSPGSELSFVRRMVLLSAEGK